MNPFARKAANRHQQNLFESTNGKSNADIAHKIEAMSPQQPERNTTHSEGKQADRPSATTNKTRVKRNVSYGNVKVREYERIIGDNPGVSSGAPIGIGWTYQSTEETDLDDHEHQRKDSSPAVPLTSDERKNMLKLWSYSSGDIEESQHKVSQIQSQRDESNASLVRYHRLKQRALDFGHSLKTTVQKLNPLRERSPQVAQATTFEVDVEKYKSPSE